MLLPRPAIPVPAESAVITPPTVAKETISLPSCPSFAPNVQVPPDVRSSTAVIMPASIVTLPLASTPEIEPPAPFSPTPKLFAVLYVTDIIDASSTEIAASPCAAPARVVPLTTRTSFLAEVLVPSETDNVSPAAKLTSKLPLAPLTVKSSDPAVSPMPLIVLVMD